MTKIIHAALPWSTVDVSLELESKKNHFYSCLFSLASHLTHFSDSEKNPKKERKFQKKIRAQWLARGICASLSSSFLSLKENDWMYSLGQALTHEK